MSASLKGTRYHKSPHHHRLNEILNFGPDTETSRLVQQRIDRISRQIQELAKRMDKLSRL